MPPLRPRNFSSRVAGVDGVHPTKNVAARLQARATHKKIRRAKDTENSKKVAAVAQVAHRRDQRIHFQVPTVPQVNAAASGSQQGQPGPPNNIPVVFPRVLPRPAFKKMTLEVISAIGLEGMHDADPILIRDMVNDLAPTFMTGLYNFTTPEHDRKKPTETCLLDFSGNHNKKVVPPTHMLAVRSSTNYHERDSAPPQMTLYPCHSMVFAVNCANLPAFPPALPRDESLPEDQIRVPCYQIVLPSVSTYPHLSHFLYTKNVNFMFNSFLPKAANPIPNDLLHEHHHIALLAAEFAETYTVQNIIKHMMFVYGLWQNMCSLGVFEESLWLAVRIMWKILLATIAIAKGHPHDMLSPYQMNQLKERQAANAAKAAAGPAMP